MKLDSKLSSDLLSCGWTIDEISTYENLLSAVNQKGMFFKTPEYKAAKAFYKSTFARVDVARGSI